MATNNGFNNAIASANSAITLNAGTNAVSISNDASATTVSIANGAAVKTLTVGSTNTTSSTIIKSGTGNIALNSGLTVDSTGRTVNTVQPAFHVYQNTSPSNVTGDGTTYVLALNTVLTNQGSSFNTTTFTFTAPVSGFYFLAMAALLTGVGAQTTFQLVIAVNYPTGTTYNGSYINPATRAAGNFLGQNFSLSIPLVANDAVTFRIIVTGGTKTIGVNGVIGQTFACGYLIC